MSLKDTPPGQVRVFLLGNVVMLQIECDDGQEMQAALTPESARIVARRLERMAYQIEQRQQQEGAK